MILLLSTNNVMAQEDSFMVLEADDNINVVVDIPREYVSSISEDELIDIAVKNELKNGDCIVIESVGFVEEATAPQYDVQPAADWTIEYPVTLTRVGSEIVMKDDFIISVARGETITLSEEYSRTVDQVITGSYYVLTFELKVSITKTISIFHVWNGPSEDSQYNSREFRIQYYGQKYNFTQDLTIDGYVSSSKSGTVTKPTRYASYSINRTI